MNKFLTSFLVAAAVSSAATVWGDEPELFDRLDKNKDGFLAGDEVDDEHKRLFERMVRVADKDADSKLSKEEFAEGQKQKDEPRPSADGSPRRRPGGPGGEGRGPGGRPGMSPKDLFASLDKNKDGKLDSEEITERLKQRFPKLDENSDGAVDQAELEKAIKEARAAGPGPGGPGAGGPNIDKMFEERDANKDGKLAASEIAEERREGFTRMLKASGKDPENGVTKDELKQVFANLARRGAGRPGGDAGRRPDGEARPPRDREGREQGPRDGERKRPEGDSQSSDRNDRRPMPSFVHAEHHSPAPLFAALDLNKDGKLSKDEIEAASSSLKKLDRNQNEEISRDEVAPSVAHRPVPHGQRPGHVGASPFSRRPHAGYWGPYQGRSGWAHTSHRGHFSTSGRNGHHGRSFAKHHGSHHHFAGHQNLFGNRGHHAHRHAIHRHSGKHSHGRHLAFAPPHRGGHHFSSHPSFHGKHFSHHSPKGFHQETRSGMGHGPAHFGRGMHVTPTRFQGPPPGHRDNHRDSARPHRDSSDRDSDKHRRPEGKPRDEKQPEGKDRAEEKQPDQKREERADIVPASEEYQANA